MISVLILTYNEELNLPACLESVKWSDDVVVLDSFSTDRTVEIAKAAGARVYQRAFDNERNQRAYSLSLPFKYGWVYNPDADEVTTPQLAREIQEIARDPSRPEVAYRVRFKVMFRGRWIKYSSLYPTWVVRLLRPDRVTFEREINLRYVLDGPEGFLRHHFEHYTFRRGLFHWFDKHNTYSTLEAREATQALARPIDWKSIFSLGSLNRRAALKDLSFRVRFRGLLVWLYLMFLRGGILDGPAGWTYCRLRSDYEYLIELKIRELRRNAQGLSL